MTRVLPSLVIIFLAGGLGSCNETAGGAGPIVSAPSATRMAGDAPCAREIDAYRANVAHDLATGNVEQKVYDQIQSELSGATSACSSGAGSQAHAIVAGSKARHGYRA